MEISAADDEDLFAMVEPESPHVDVYSLAQRRHVARVTFDFEVRSVALFGDAQPLVVAGAWRSDGVVALRMDGTCAWQWKDLTRSHVLRPIGSWIAATFESSPAKLLSRSTGKWKISFPHARDVWGTPDLLVVATANTLALHTSDGTQCWSVPSRHVFVAALGHGVVLASEAEALVARSLDDGTECWRWSPGGGQWVVELVATETGWAAVCSGGGLPARLSLLDASGKEARAIASLDIDSTFLGQRYVITSSREVLGLDGEVLWAFGGPVVATRK